MSHEALCWASGQRCGGQTAKAVLWVLASCHNGKTGQCNPSLTTIAEEAEMSRRTVATAIQALAERGLITIRPSRRDDGSIASNSYILHFNPPAAAGDRPSSAPSAAPALPSAGAALPSESPALPLVQELHYPVQELHGGSAGAALPLVQELHYMNQEVRTRNGTKTPTESLGAPADAVVPAAAPAKRAAAPRGTRLPEGWAPSEDLIEWARREAPAAGPRDHEDFVDYWTAATGARAAKADWPATWRRWMRKASDERSAVPTRTGPRGTSARIAGDVGILRDALDRARSAGTPTQPTITTIVRTA